MRVLFFLLGAYPTGSATSKRFHSMAKGLLKNNVDAEIVLLLPSESPNAIRNRHIRGEFEGVCFRNLSSSTIRKRSLLGRLSTYVICYIKLIFFLLFNVNRRDFLVLHTLSRSWYVLFFLLRIFIGYKVVCELTEYPYVYLNDEKLKANKLQYITRKIYPRFDAFLVISHALKKFVKEVCDGRTLVVPILSYSYNSVQLTHKLPHENYIFHSGTLTEQKDGFCGMVEAFGMVKKKLGNSLPLKFIVTGTERKIVDFNKYRKLLEQYQIKDDIHFVGFLDESTLRAYQYGSKLFIINKLDTIQNKYCFSTKICEYLSCSRPVILTRVGEYPHYFRDNDNAIVVEPGSPALIAEGILNLLANPDICKSIGEKGSELIYSHFDSSYHAKQIIEFFKSIN